MHEVSVVLGSVDFRGVVESRVDLIIIRQILGIVRQAMRRQVVASEVFFELLCIAGIQQIPRRLGQVLLVRVVHRRFDLCVGRIAVEPRQFEPGPGL